MAMRGTRPTPTVVRRLRGNPGKRALNHQEPQPPALGPDIEAIPPELAGDVRAAREWQRLVPMLRRCRLITDADRAALIALCLEWSRYVTATEQGQALGLVVKAPVTGTPMVNPFLGIARAALQACAKLWPELGLTPSSRSRIKTDGPGPDGDSFSEFDVKQPRGHIN